MLIQLLSMEGRLGILIVENDLLQSMMLEKVIESLNHSVLGTTMHGESAVDLAVDLKPDIIFMDIALAGSMSGIESARIINTNSNAAIIYVTGNSLAKDNEELKKTQFKDILIKPISKTDIQTVFSKYIANK